MGAQMIGQNIDSDTSSNSLSHFYSGSTSAKFGPTLIGCLSIVLWTVSWLLSLNSDYRRYMCIRLAKCPLATVTASQQMSTCVTEHRAPSWRWSRRMMLLTRTSVVPVRWIGHIDLVHTVKRHLKDQLSTGGLLLLYYTIRNPTKQYGISISPTSQYGVLSGQRLTDIFRNKNNMS